MIYIISTPFHRQRNNNSFASALHVSTTVETCSAETHTFYTRSRMQTLRI
jgi:hypothetical protein